MNANGRPFSALPDNADARYDHVIVPNPRRRDEIPIGHWPDDAVGESSVSNLPSRSQPWGSTLGHIDPRITDLTTGYPSNMPSWNDTQDSSLPNTDSRGMQPFRSDDMELVMTTTAGAIENAGGYSSNSSLEVNLNCTANTLVEVGTMFNPMDVDGFSAISNFQCDLDAFSNSHIPDGVVPAFGPSSLALPDMDFILFKDADPTNPRIWKCGRNNCAKAFTKRHLYNKHVLSHDRFYICSFKDCAFSAYQKKDIRRHSAAVHHKAKHPCPFQDCPYSEKGLKEGLSRPDALKRHLQKHASISTPVNDDNQDGSIRPEDTELDSRNFSTVASLDEAESNDSFEWG